jgi:MFS family permease
MRKRKVLAPLFAANLISGFASGITMLAIPWHLTSQLGNSNGKFLNALMMAIITFASILWGLYAGTLIDKYNRKRIFQLMNLADGLVLCGAALAGHLMGEVPFLLMFLVSSASLLTYTIHYPNLYAFVQELFDAKEYQRVNSAIEIQNQVTSSLGMVMGGLFLAGSQTAAWWPEALGFRPWGLHEIFLLDGVTYFLSFLLISLIPYTPGAYRRLSDGKVWERLRSGFAYLRDNKPLLIFGLASYVIYFSLLIFMQVILSIHVGDVLGKDYAEGARVSAGFRAVYSLGAVAAGVLGFLVEKMLASRRHVGAIAVMVLLAGCIYFSWSLTRSVWWFTTSAFLIGIFNAGVRILRITTIAKKVPNHLIGRTNSFFQTANGLARGLFILVLLLPFFSAPAQGHHIIWATAALGVVCLCCAALLVGSRVEAQPPLPKDK